MMPSSSQQGLRHSGIAHSGTFRAGFSHACIAISSRNFSLRVYSFTAHPFPLVWDGVGLAVSKRVGVAENRAKRLELGLFALLMPGRRTKPGWVQNQPDACELL